VDRQAADSTMHDVGEKRVNQDMPIKD